MSPLTRPGRSKAGVSKTSEWTVKGSAKGLGLGSGTKSVKVRVLEGEVRATWLDATDCATRRFSAHELREFIKMVDGPGHRFKPDMWLQMSGRRISSYGPGSFFVRVNEEGELTANTSAEDHGWVPWESLKHALESALEELDSAS